MSLNKLGSIYCITNLVNGKIYIGKTINTIDYRFAQHKREHRGNTILKQAFKKYGVENFKIESLFESYDEAELYRMEALYIQLFDTKNHSIGYNLADGGGRNSGWKMSEEAKAKIKIERQKPRLGGRTPIIAYNKTTGEITEILGVGEASNFFGVLNTSIGNNLNNRSEYVTSKQGKIKFTYKVN